MPFDRKGGHRSLLRGSAAQQLTVCLLMASAEVSPSRQSLGARDAALLALHEEFYNRRAWLAMQALKKIAKAQTADDTVPDADRICKPTIDVVGAIPTPFLFHLWSCMSPLAGPQP